MIASRITLVAKPSQKVVNFMVKIDHDVPIPSKEKRKQRDYPFAEMEIGDSFAVPISLPEYQANSTETLNMEIRRVRHRLVAMAGGVARAAGMSAKFITCYMPEEKAVRIWRIEKSKGKQDGNLAQNVTPLNKKREV